jgi:hypothetical protein
MTKRHTTGINPILFLALSAITGVFFAAYLNHKTNIRASASISLPVVQHLQNQPTLIFVPTPTSIPSLAPTPKTETFSQVSPDGTNTLTMTVTTNQDLTKTYVFTTFKGTNTTQKLIYNTTLPSVESMVIPFNTWSPDNAYVFLQHNSLGSNEVIVMKADGQPLSEGEQYYNVKTLFTARNTGDSYRETTGWASETLLIINTTLPGGSKGPSYWFEVPSKAIIQLSTQF